MSEPTTDPAATPPNPDSGEPTSFEVQRLHRAPIDEYTDPQDGKEPIPAWAMFAFGALLLWGGFYGGQLAGGFRADVMDRPDAPAAPVMKAAK